MGLFRLKTKKKLPRLNILGTLIGGHISPADGIANTMHTRQYSYNGGGACRNFSGSSSALVFDTIKMRGNDTTPRPRHKRDEKAVLITVFQRIR
jgi:hypothetical protein